MNEDEGTERSVEHGPDLALIGGTSRSGSTILRQVLRHHPQIIGFDREMRILADPDGIGQYRTLLSQTWSPDIATVATQRLVALLRRVGKGGRVAGLGGPPQARRASDASSLPDQSARRAQQIARLRRRATESLKRSPAYGAHVSVNLSEQCPSYLQAVETLAGRLRDTAFPGRWIGSRLGALDQLQFGPDLAAADKALRSFLASVFVGHVDHDPELTTHFLDDTPFNALAFPSLLPLRPDAKLIFIRRNPVGTTLSLMGSRWGPKEPVTAARYVAAVLDQWERVKQTIPGSAVHEVWLEDIVDSPEVHLKEVTQFLDVPWDEALSGFVWHRESRTDWQRHVPAGRRDEFMRTLHPYEKAERK